MLPSKHARHVLNYNEDTKLHIGRHGRCNYGEDGRLHLD